MTHLGSVGEIETLCNERLIILSHSQPPAPDASPRFAGEFGAVEQRVTMIDKPYGHGEFDPTDVMVEGLWPALSAR